MHVYLNRLSNFVSFGNKVNFFLLTNPLIDSNHIAGIDYIHQILNLALNFHSMLQNGPQDISLIKHDLQAMDSHLDLSLSCRLLIYQMHGRLIVIERRCPVYCIIIVAFFIVWRTGPMEEKLLGVSCHITLSI